MEEDAIAPRLGLLSLDEKPLGLSKVNMRRLTKCKGAPKRVRKLTKTRRRVLMRCRRALWRRSNGKSSNPVLDRDGRRFLKDEAKNKKQWEKEKRKKSKAKAKKKAREERKCRKEVERKGSKMLFDSSSGSDSSSESAGTSGAESSSDS